MKKRNLLLLGLVALTLTGCQRDKEDEDDKNDPPVTEKLTLKDSFFDEFKLGYSLESLVKETIKEGEKEEVQYYYVDAMNNNDIYSYFEYAGAKDEASVKKDEVKQSETYYKIIENGKDYAKKARLGIDNKLNYNLVRSNEFTDGWTFSEVGYLNFFKDLTSANFISTSEESIYEFKDDETNNSLKKYIATQLYGDPGLNLDKFSLTIDKNGIKELNSSLSFKGAKATYSYSFKTKVVEKGKETKVKEKVKPLEEIEDANFTLFNEALKNKNFTFTHVDYDDFGDAVAKATIKSTGDRYVSNYSSSESGAKSDKAGYILDDKFYTTSSSYDETNNTYTVYKGVETDEKTYNQFVPTLKEVSRAVFNENNKVYTLKNDIDFDFQNLTPFEALAQSLSTFNLKVTEDASKNVSFVFSSTSKNGYKTEITFTDLNKVNGNDLFDPASLTEAPVTGFKESLFAAPADFETTISYLGEISDKFNVPDELYEDGAWMVLKESIGTDTTLNYLDLVYAGASYDSATFDDLYVNYLTKMMDLGWTLNEEEECLVLEDYKLKALNQVDAGDNYFVIELSKPKA